MKLIEKTRYRIQYVGKDETYAPLVKHLDFIQSREYEKKETAERWRRSYIEGERWSFYESDFILVPVNAAYVKDSFGPRYLKALKEQVKTNEAPMLLLFLAGMIAFVSILVAIVCVVFPAFAAGEDTSVGAWAATVFIAGCVGVAAIGWLGGAFFDLDRRKDLRLPA